MSGGQRGAFTAGQIADQHYLH
ncbi:unnamed protein product [Cyprideis torosa]|uniref:Uncharacterized protein n=1 Tax=Cyprideis torosa TaxID=163714 RepID=A0A7R8WGS5_9CRUS|nr:unnamed protein product [Cyprideis torosa]CAG0896963.1 unnamed protein product [Cyprideis torosa]